MSECISRRGEYSEHLYKDGVCQDCGHVREPGNPMKWRIRKCAPGCWVATRAFLPKMHFPSWRTAVESIDATWGKS